MTFNLSEHIYNFRGTITFLDYFFYVLAEYSSIFFILSFSIVIGVEVFKNKGLAFKVLSYCFVILSTFITNQILRRLVQRERPFVVNQFDSLIEHSASYSFPSNHAAMSFIVALTIYRLNPKIGKYFLFLAGFVSLSRVYVGVHYPSDIIAGALLALAIFKLFELFLLQHKKSQLGGGFND
ncbi:phosphatase PAP2 family protein [Proteinivorax hydrogeniformans]|uniref:Phosphatase PAP2 family protein n=1 Tax=Proteinivorax hydrogeniformans TaxID=1826727 RepID=A0AAU8HPI2_9FIRM